MMIHHKVMADANNLHLSPLYPHLYFVVLCILLNDNFYVFKHFFMVAGMTQIHQKPDLLDNPIPLNIN